MSHAIGPDMRDDASSSAAAVAFGRRDLLANMVRLAGGALASSLCAGRTLADDAPAGVVGSRAGYYPTTWPSEHTDLWRSHAVFGAGLPADVARRPLLVSTA